MKNQPTNLWWGYDSDSGSFAPLPAGPLLLPAIIIVGIVSLFRGFGSEPRSLRSIFGSLVDTPHYQQCLARYLELGEKRGHNDGLELWEHEEYMRLRESITNPYGFPKKPSS